MKSLNVLILLSVVAFLGSGCTATHLTAFAEDNPLPQIAEKAAEDYKVDRIDDNTLELRDTWVLSSIGGLGWYTSHANLQYNPDENKLYMKYYLRSIALWTLYIPSYLDAEPGLVGGAMKSTMNSQIDEILKWGKIDRSTVKRSDCDVDAPLGTEDTNKG